MPNTLSVRSYSAQPRAHVHPYHQLVLPVQGLIDIQVGHYKAQVAVGECIVIYAGILHEFKAHTAARFVVADMAELPENLTQLPAIHFAISSPFLSYLQFITLQLADAVHPKLEQLLWQLFVTQLENQKCAQKVDPRIAKVIATMQADLCQTLSLQHYANIACLSLTQFKLVFKQSTGCSASHYLTQLKMEKAKALLTHTDMPISLIAEQLGYQNHSAFSRRFCLYFAQPPSAFRR
ncbi:helix-turn-helix domain-containing protein [Pseudoalteromonas fenneropenaei]|uniref:Helix-turn-helix domain-containing protein n=1 Tax=Pseudoalteromonas fenneropenaei TaxID=1737459 RepID=A0ABV7CFZ4_9GAMM